MGGWGTDFHHNYYDLSLHVAPINDSIDILAKAFSSGVPYMQDEKGNLTQESPLIDFLLRPNKDQNFKEFSKDFIRNLIASGYSYLLPTSDNTAFLRRLNALDSENRPELKVLNTDYIDYLDARNKSISGKFNYAEQDIQTQYDFSEVIPFWDLAQDPCNYRIGVSRLCSIEDEIRNIIIANRAKTNKIKQSGKFLVTPKSSGVSNQIGLPLDQPVNINKPDYKQRDLIEDKLESTGFANKKSITVTNKEMYATNVMESIQNYSYDDETKEDRRTIKNTLGTPRELQNIGDDQSRYENRKEAFLELFTLNVMPIAVNFTESIQQFYAPEEKRKLILDYSHHPAFEIVENKKEERNKEQVDTLIKLFEKELVSKEDITKKLIADGII